MKYLESLALIILLSSGAQAKASPTGADLLTACEESLASGFDGVRGMMCTWYVNPCDCSSGKEPGVQRVCLPAEKETEDLAREVIEGLKSQPGLHSESAEVASSTILSVKYPCE